MVLVFLSLSLMFCTAEAATTCPDQWIAYQGSCYRFVHQNLTFYDAESYCRQHHGRLVHLETARENGFVKETISHMKEKEWWIGLTDDDIEGQWAWYGSDESPLFTDWSSGQPNGGDEDCAQFFYLNDAWEWHDFRCNKANGSPICEMETEAPVNVIG
ncbi:C-type lectin domain 4 member E [Mactra antiquata]